MRGFMMGSMRMIKEKNNEKGKIRRGVWYCIYIPRTAVLEVRCWTGSRSGCKAVGRELGDLQFPLHSVFTLFNLQVL